MNHFEQDLLFISSQRINPFYFLPQGQVYLLFQIIRLKKHCYLQFKNGSQFFKRRNRRLNLSLNMAVLSL